MDWTQRRVQFKIRDVYHPDPAKILADLYGNDLLTGTILDLSDSGMQKEVFAVIEVQGIEDLLIVLVERIVGTLEDENAGEPTR